MTSEVFLTVLRVTDNLDELHATRELLLKEIAQVVSPRAPPQLNLIVWVGINHLMSIILYF